MTMDNVVKQALHFFEDAPKEIQTKAKTELTEYLSGSRQRFSLPYLLPGTPFQKAVWQAIEAIPYGQTQSYQDIARAIGKPKAYRAVGQACNANPLPIIVPCHRVVGSHSMGGYGFGLSLKQELLDLETSVAANHHDPTLGHQRS